jgi:hypothetical protein
MIAPEYVEKLKGLPEWKALKEHVQKCALDLDSITSIMALEIGDLELETAARVRAFQIIQAIFQPFHIEITEVPIDLRKEGLRKIGL